jgi:hypothetical protein
LAEAAGRRRVDIRTGRVLAGVIDGAHIAHAVSLPELEEPVMKMLQSVGALLGSSTVGDTKLMPRARVFGIMCLWIRQSFAVKSCAGCDMA